MVINVIRKAIFLVWRGFAVLFLSAYPSLPTLLPLLKINVSVRRGDMARHSGVREARPLMGKGSPWVK